MSFSEHVVDLAEFDISGVESGQQSAFHIVMRRQGNEALIEGRSGVRAEGFNHSTYFSCFGTQQQLLNLADLLSRKDGNVVQMRPASPEVHPGNHPITFRCQAGEINLRRLDIESSFATDHVHKITLKDLWDRKLPASQAVEYFAQRLNDLLKDF
ncbi:hypothetical protein [Deinococcus humi]|uniref:Uncharacterized protein n=1 Tax=Deinococcus humi TaxID=662880 RepID=A0A7W8JX39_9DEIO|nr:hypothetical protein [Deinococcus humi]MBB5364851.1 hypothetical protein [Deinococcus humi]GGO33894.1 hypothetical protein GCM10008949_33840 [Deinococcus humi]